MQYLQDLDLVESVFIKPLRAANPPVIASHLLDDFIDELFSNILDLRECNRRLLELLTVRQREESPVILGIGDIFLNAATEFRLAYSTYIGHYPISEKKLRDETEANPKFKLFLEVCAVSLAGSIHLLLTIFNGRIVLVSKHHELPTLLSSTSNTF